MAGLFEQMQADAGASAPAAGSIFAQMQADAAPAPTPVPRAPTASGSVLGGAVQGVGDVQNAGAQWLYNLMPKSVQDAGDSADHWLYDKTGGAIGTKPGMTFNNAVADQNQNYEASRAANGRTGMDWARAAGAGSAQALAAALTGGQSAMAAGVTGGVLTPVTTMTQGSDTQFGPEAGKNVALGGLLGKGVGMAGNAVAGAVSPQVKAMARALMDEGINLTPGQMFGGFTKSMEDKLTSVPIVGDMIKGAQGRAVDGLNTAAYQRVLSPLKEAGFDTQLPKTVGRDAVESVTQQVQGAYNALLPKLTTQMDPQFAQQVGHLSEMVSSGNLGKAESEQFHAILENKVLSKFMGQNAITGETLKAMESDLGNLAGTYRGTPLGGAVMELQSNLRSLVERSNPQYAGQLSKINDAFANLTRVQSAAAMQGAPNGVFTAAQLSAAVKGGDQTVRDNAFAQGRARMQDLSDPAKTMLGSSVPNSGTSDRAMTAGALGALLANPANMINPAVFGGLIPALAYTKPGVSAMNLAVTQRSPQVQALAAALRRVSDQGAQPAAGAALTYGR